MDKKINILVAGACGSGKSTLIQTVMDTGKADSKMCFYEMNDTVVEEKPGIHMLWYCMDASSNRLSKDILEDYEEIKNEWDGIPIIVALTKSDYVTEDDDNIARVREAMSRKGEITEEPLAFIPVSIPIGGGNTKARGITELIDFTLANMDMTSCL